MAPNGYSLILAHLSAIDCCEQSTCGSASTALDCMISVDSFESTGQYITVNGDQAHGLSASGMSWGQADAAQSGLAESAGSDMVCQASIFFANRRGAGGVAVGCPCKSCMKTNAFLPTNEPNAQLWRYQYPEPSSRNYEECFASKNSGASRNQLIASSPGSPASEVSPTDQTLRMLLDRARQGFGITSRGVAPAPVQPLRRSTPGRSIRPTYQHFQAPPMHRRPTEARSTSPIPVPSPPHPRASAGSHRDWRHDAAAQSASDELYNHIPGAPNDQVAQIEDLRRDKMVRTVMQFYDAKRKQRAKRPPGRPSDPHCVVIGFELMVTENRECNDSIL